MGFWRSYSLAITWSALILYLTLKEPGSIESAFDLFKGFDKLAHFGVFCILSFLSCWGTHHYKKIDISVVVLGMILFGAAIELLQSYIYTYRSGDWIDFLADVLGIGFGWIIFHYYQKFYLQ